MNKNQDDEKQDKVSLSVPPAALVDLRKSMIKANAVVVDLDLDLIFPRQSLNFIDVSSTLLANITQSSLKAFSVAEQLSQMMDVYLAPIQKFQENMLKVSDVYTNVVAPLVESTSFVSAAISMELDVFKKLEGLTIALPITELAKSVSIQADLSLKIDKYRPITGLANTYDLGIIATHSTEQESFGLNFISKVEMRMTRIERKVDITNEGISYLVEDAKRKDETLQSLVDSLHKEDSLMRIERIKYNKRSAVLCINGKEISIEGDSIQHEICSMVLSTKTGRNTLWYNAELVEAIEGSFSDAKLTPRSIYDAAYQLNKKIELATRIKDFLIPTSKTLSVNVNYKN